MYATRSQTTKENDVENNKAELQNNKAKGLGVQNRPPVNRRALADVGNFVSNANKTNADIHFRKAGPTKANAAEKRLKKNPAAVQAVPDPSAPIPIPVPDAEGTDKWGGKGTRTRSSLLPKESSSNTVSLSTTEVTSQLTGVGSTASNVIAPGRVKQVYTRASRNKVVSKEREQSMTATLTSQSEAASADSETSDATKLPLPDIDFLDHDNPLAVTDYIEDIYEFYRKAESQSMVGADYMLSQQDINDKMRAILIDWLIEVHLKFKLMPETLYLTTNLIDRFLENEQVQRKNLQLVGVTAMLLASKYEEIWAPEVKDFVYISDNAYNKDQILAMEKRMLNTLKFNLTVPTPYVFTARFLKAAGADKQGETIAWFMIELSLPEYVMLQFSPSHVAASAVYISQRMLGKYPTWTNALERHTQLTESQLRLCANHMIMLHEKCGTGNLTAVHKKYSHPKFLEVAKLSPATLPIEDNSSFC